MPVQYFQSVIAIELAVTGALLWQINFFDSKRSAPREGELPDTRLRILMALVLGATVFGSLWAMVDEGRSRWPAIAVTIGLAISIIPILLRVLPPLARDAATSERDPNYGSPLPGWSCMSALSPAFSSCSTSTNRARVRDRRTSAQTRADHGCDATSALRPSWR